jgi:hypothetical protein
LGRGGLPPGHCQLHLLSIFVVICHGVLWKRARTLRMTNQAPDKRGYHCILGTATAHCLYWHGNLPRTCHGERVKTLQKRRRSLITFSDASPFRLHSLFLFFFILFCWHKDLIPLTLADQVDVSQQLLGRKAFKSHLYIKVDLESEDRWRRRFVRFVIMRERNYINRRLYSV